MGAVAENASYVPDHELRRRAAVFLRQRHNDAVLHPHRPSKRCVRFYGDVVLLADVSDVGLSVERVDLDLVDFGMDSRLGGHQLLDLRVVWVSAER